MSGEREIVSTEEQELGCYTNWMDGLARNKNGVRQTIQNAMYALQTAPELKGILQYNEFTGRTEVSGDKCGWKRYTISISDLDLDHIRYVMERGKITRDAAIMSAINLEAHRRAYHPVKNILNSLQWDGRDHISELLPRYLGAERCEYTTMVTKMIFGGIIHRIMQPGCKFDLMPILVDTTQGGGKSTMVRFIAMSDVWYTTIKHLDDPDKFVETLSGHLVVEMEELEGLITAKSIETVRAFLSRSMDTYRTPYAKYSQDIPRQSICIGTSNDPSCLPQDRAGNRRFLPIRCNKDKAELHPLDNEEETRKDVEQCYAQAMHLYREKNLPAKLPAEWEKRLPEEQRDFLPEDIKAGKIQDWIEGNDLEEGYYCAAMIYQEALDNVGLPKIWESKEIGAILDGLKDDNGNKLLERYTGSGGIHRFKDYGRQRAWIKRDHSKQSCSQSTQASDAEDSSVNGFRSADQEEIPFK